MNPKRIELEDRIRSTALAPKRWDDENHALNWKFILDDIERLENPADREHLYRHAVMKLMPTEAV